MCFLGGAGEKRDRSNRDGEGEEKRFRNEASRRQRERECGRVSHARRHTCLWGEKGGRCRAGREEGKERRRRRTADRRQRANASFQRAAPLSTQNLCLSPIPANEQHATHSSSPPRTHPASALSQHRSKPHNLRGRVLSGGERDELGRSSPRSLSLSLSPRAETEDRNRRAPWSGGLRHALLSRALA